MRRERLYLEDILVAADAIGDFIAEQDLDSFGNNRLLQSAVVHQLTIIGEAVARLSPELLARYPEVPWPDIVGLRNIVVHHYFGIDWEEVWRTAAADAPALKLQVAGILKKEFPE